jgi:hypothetical protein
MANLLETAAADVVMDLAEDLDVPTPEVVAVLMDLVEVMAEKTGRGMRATTKALVDGLVSDAAAVSPMILGAWKDRGALAAAADELRRVRADRQMEKALRDLAGFARKYLGVTV